MILTADLGNSNFVAGMLERDRVNAHIRLVTDRDRPSRWYSQALLEGFTPKHISRVEGAVLSSVVPALTDTVARAIRLATGVEPLILRPDTCTGLDICVSDPSTVGSDLIAGALGVLDRYRLPAVIVDMGTATTFSVLDGMGRYQGHSIMPGVALSADALLGRASHLPRPGLGEAGSAVGKTTREALASGIVYGAAAMVDGMVERIEAELGCLTTVIATGGLAEAIIPHCRRKILLDNHLLFHGLYKVWIAQPVAS